MNTQATNKIRVSVIVPARNEARYLGACLESILANDFPKEELEILVVDGRSEDATCEIAESFKGRGPEVRIIDNPERIAPTALNRGLKEARGEIIMRVDSHGEVACDFIRKTVETLEKVPEAGCVGGWIEPEGQSLASQVIARAQASFFGAGGGSWYRMRKAGFVDTVFNAAFRRSVFERVGYFDETLVRNQDEEFNYRLREKGYKIYFNPEIRGRYYVRQSIFKLAKQYFQYGFWKVKIVQKRTQMIQFRHLVPPLFVAAIILLSAAGLVIPNAHAVLGILLGAYFLSCLAAAFMLGRKEGWKFISFFPFVFWTIHFSYGLGFWMGAIYFLLIRKERYA